MFPKKGNITQPNNRRPIDIEPWTSKITYEIESEWWYGRVRATLDVDQCVDHMGCKPHIRIDDAFLCLKLFVAKTKYNKISVFILWAWILRVHLIATHMMTIMTSELPAASYIKNWPNKKTDSWWLDSYQATHKLQHQKYARGKYICLPYVHLAPFLKQFSKKTLLKRGSGRTIFFGGKWRWGTAGPILVSFQRTLFVWDRHARSHEKTKFAVAVKPLRCMAALRLNKSVFVHAQRVDCPMTVHCLVLCKESPSQHGQQNVAGGTGNLAECCHSVCLEDVEGFKHVQTKKRSNHEWRSILISLTAKRRKFFPTRKQMKNAAATWCTFHSMISVWPAFWINIYILRNVWRTCQGVHRKTK